MAQQMKMSSTVIKSAQSSGMNAFLKKKDPETEKLKEILLNGKK